MERAILETPSHAQALGVFHAEPLAPLLAPARAWDLDAPERIFDGRELAAWPLPRGWTAPVQPRGFPGRARVAVEPLRQQGVVGDLAAALADIADAPQWVDPVRRALAVVADPKSTRAQIRAALVGKGRAA